MKEAKFVVPTVCSYNHVGLQFAAVFKDHVRRFEGNVSHTDAQ